MGNLFIFVDFSFDRGMLLLYDIISHSPKFFGGSKFGDIHRKWG